MQAGEEELMSDPFSLDNELVLLIPKLAYSDLVTCCQESESAARVLLGHLLLLSCQCQNAGRMMLARRALATVPSETLVTRLVPLAHELIDQDDEWEFRRLLELLSFLGLEHALREAIEVGLRSSQAEVVEAAAGFSQGL